jgi:hypothetical protein
LHLFAFLLGVIAATQENVDKAVAAGRGNYPQYD